MHLIHLNTDSRHDQEKGHACRYGAFFFLWSLVRFNCARNSLEH